MDLISTIILSIVEGLTEFLPISSTGHLILTAEILKIPQTEFVKSFEVIIQLGAIAAISFLYWKKLIKNLDIWKKIFTAFLPTAIIGFTLYPFIREVLIGNALITVSALFIGGIILIILELLYKENTHSVENIEELSYKNSFIIGIFQSLAIIPGVSRAGATIVGGLLIGAKRKTAVEFSFILAIPTMLAATGLDLLKSNFAYTVDEYLLLAVGLVISFIVALFAAKFFLRFIQTNSFILFGVYRIILASLFWLIFIK